MGPPVPPPSPETADGSPAYPKNFVRSQEHLLKESRANPAPTEIPPPGHGTGLGGMGDRHVICFVGLPARGKQFMAEKMCRYLRFFHGAQCEIFDLADDGHETDQDVADALTAYLAGVVDVKMHPKMSDCARDFAQFSRSRVETSTGQRISPNDRDRSEGEEKKRLRQRYLEAEDATATTQLLRATEGIDDDSLDRLKKNVDSGRIAILDTSDGFSTRTRVWAGATKAARYEMQKQLDKLRVRVKLLFIEVIVSDHRVVRRFLAERLRVDDDGNERPPARLGELIRETELRIRDYGRSYVTIQDDGSEDDLSYVKLIDYGNKVITNRIRGFLLMQIVKYLSHVHPKPRAVYLSRHGQSVYNAQKKIGGNPGLTAAGEGYARWLGAAVPGEIWASAPRDDDGDPTDAARARPLFGRLYPCRDGATGETTTRTIAPARLWTSTLKRTIDTARHVPHPVLELRDGSVWHQMSPRVYRNLDEIFAGDCEGMTYAEIESQFRDEALLRKRDKLGYRYPRGESYLDLIARVDPLVHELESYEEPLLVVSHQATLRILYAYLTNRPRADAPKIAIPLHTLIKVTWDGWGNIHEEHIKYDGGDPAADADLHDDGQNSH